MDHIVDVITQDRKQWIDTMVTEEFGIWQLKIQQYLRAALSTFVAFVGGYGFIPLVPFFFTASRVRRSSAARRRRPSRFF